MAWFITDCSSSHHAVRCAHKSDDVINFIIVACSISSRLKWCKNYKYRLRLAKVIVKNKLSRFYGSVCMNCVIVSLQIGVSSWDQQLHFVGGLTLPRSNLIWLKNGNDVITPPPIVRFTTKSRRHEQDDMPMTTTFGKNRNRKYNSSMTAVHFPKPEIVLSPPYGLKLK